VKASKDIAVCAKTAFLGVQDTWTFLPACLRSEAFLLTYLDCAWLEMQPCILVWALLDLSAVEAECRVVGTAASLGPEQPPLANVVAEAICGIKLQVCQSSLQSSVPQTAGTRTYIGRLIYTSLSWFATEQVKALLLCSLLGNHTLL